MLIVAEDTDPLGNSKYLVAQPWDKRRKPAGWCYIVNEDSNIGRWMSEKFDGLRARWDGSKLYFKNGKTMDFPENFTKDFPKSQLDGELW
jgi:hypothetical protein